MSELVVLVGAERLLGLVSSKLDAISMAFFHGIVLTHSTSCQTACHCCW